MSTYFISDLHLSSQHPERAERFLRFLEGPVLEADALYILGDLFDRWVGDDDQHPHHEQIIAALYHLYEQSLPVYFMHGNRDFLIGSDFILRSGCVLLEDPSVITLYGTQVLLSHGDRLCTRDTKYQGFKKFVRHPWTRSLFLKCPLSVRHKIARLLRAQSSRDAATLPTGTRQPYWDVALEAVYADLRQHQCHTLIHGHTHLAQIHDFILDEQPAKRIVLGAWDQTPIILIYSDDGTLTLRNLV